MIIENDVHDIVGRLKGIDGSYAVALENGAFLLYGGERGEFIMKLPFDRLDERTVRHVMKTRVERADELIAELDRENAAVEERALREAKIAMKENLKLAAERAIYDERRLGGASVGREEGHVIKHESGSRTGNYDERRG